MRSVNAPFIAEFCARQFESSSCVLMRGIDLSHSAAHGTCSSASNLKLHLPTA